MKSLNQLYTDYFISVKVLNKNLIWIYSNVRTMKMIQLILNSWYDEVASVNVDSLKNCELKLFWQFQFTFSLLGEAGGPAL